MCSKAGMYVQGTQLRVRRHNHSAPPHPRRRRAGPSPSQIQTKPAKLIEVKLQTLAKTCLYAGNRDSGGAVETQSKPDKLISTKFNTELNPSYLRQTS